MFILAGDVDIIAAPKSWTIDEVVSFIQRTDLKDSIDKFKDNVSSIHFILVGLIILSYTHSY